MNRDLKTENKETPFWERKTLEEMTPEEWDSLCDGCAKCCLNKLEDEKTGKVYYTIAACRLLDAEICRCTSYENRAERVPGCAVLTPKNVREFYWLPETCAYRRLVLGKALFRWHHLISGDRELIHRLGLSVRNKVVSELDVDPKKMTEHILEWL